jgi:glycosyltransferase involved in cell wall biosynthesis/thioredoxin-like negative regulator of GroEL
LRPDALTLLSNYLEINQQLEGAFSDELITTDTQEIFENTNANIVTTFPNEIEQFNSESVIFPSVFIFRKSIWEKIPRLEGESIEELNKNFWKSALQINLRFEKAEMTLGLCSVEIQDLKNEQQNAELLLHWKYDKLNRLFGKHSVRLFSSQEQLQLPYHFNNIFNDLVSIIVLIPQTTTKEEIQRTLTSIQYQTHTNFEILKPEKSFPNDKEIQARNLLSRIANGKYIAYIHSGDELSPNFISKLFSILNNYPPDYFAYSDYYQSTDQKIIQNLDYNFEKLKKFNYIPCTNLIPRTLILRVDGFDEQFPTGYSVWDFWLKIGELGGSGIRIPEPLFTSYFAKDILFAHNPLEDANQKARILLKHPKLFSEMQINWAKETLESGTSFDNSKIPIGVIPNNILLSKIITTKKKDKKTQQLKKILFVMYGWKETGGGTTFPRAVAQELSRRGFEISVFYASLKYDSSFPPYSIEQHNEEKIQLFGLFNRPAVFNDPDNPEREVLDPNVVEKFRQVVESVQPDIIHFHNFHGLTLALPKVAKEYNVPLVYTPHNYHLIDPNLYLFNPDLSLWSDTDFFSNSQLIRKNPDKLKAYEQRQEVGRQILNEWIDLTLAVSQRQRELLLEFSGASDKITVVHQVHPIVDNLWQNEKLKSEATRKLPERLRYVFFGGVMPHKGVHILANASQYFIPNDVEFHIYGFVGAKYLEQLQKIDKKKVIKFHGEYQPEALVEIASNCDIGIFPSIWEDCAPLVLLEMNAMRLPIIASNIGGIPDFVVDGVNGFLYEYNSVDALVATIHYCNLNRDKIEEMRQSLVQLHSFNTYIDHIINIYNSLANKELINAREAELLITPKLLQQGKRIQIPSSGEKFLPNDVQRHFQSVGFEIIRMNIKEDTKDYIHYEIEFKARKPVTLEEFMEKGIEKVESISEPDEFKQSEKEFEVSDLTELVEYAPKVETYIENENNIKVEMKNQDNLLFSNTSSDSEMYAKPKPELNVVWEGSQFVYHSLALINREHCSNLIDSECVEVTIVPYETEQFSPAGNPKYEKLARYDIRYKQEPPIEVKKLPYLWIRHQWPPKSEPPQGAKWVIMQPWEFSTLPRRFVEIFRNADELWVPSNYTRQAFINSGLDFNKVQVIPNGIDPELFQPKGRVFNLNTKKRLKFLYVGGTTYRKGIDILLQSYISTFTANDNVTLIVKDMGTESFYKGQTAEEQIKSIQQTPNTPEIIYIKDYLTEEEIASLFRACDVFVSPYRGEGFSLPTLEAMACGLPVIVTEGGATEDFVLDSFGWKIPSYKISIGNQIDKDPLVGEAFILEPDGDYLSGLMRAIYRNPSDITVRGLIASRYARTLWTWKRSTLKLLSRIDALYGKELAQKAMSKLTDITDEQIRLGIAEEFFSNGDIEQAKEEYLRILPNIEQLSEKYQNFLNLRMAITEFLLGNFDEATSYIQKTQPNNIDSLYIEAKILRHEGNIITALEKYSDLVSRWKDERFDSVLGYSLDILLVDMGDIMLEMDDYDSGLQLFTEAKKLNPNNSLAFLGAGKCFLQVKDYEEAKRMFNWVLKLEPDNQEAKQILEGIK